MLMVLGEVLIPRRIGSQPRLWRWLSNLGLAVVNTALLRLLPLAAVGVAAIAQQQGWGLFQIVALPTGAEIAIAVILLDLLIYGQHAMFHRVPLLWRVHRVHHTDLDLDSTTGIRFHPIEILLSMGLKIIAVILLGAPPLAVIIFEIVLNATALFNHSNIRLSNGLDRRLRLLLVTPDMHRVHHSVIPSETNSNFGFNLPWWDYLFGTYCAQPQAGHEAMKLGLPDFTKSQTHRLDWLLILPFQGEDFSNPKNLKSQKSAIPID